MLDEKYHVGMFHRILAFFFDMVALAITLMIVGSITTGWMVVQSNAPAAEGSDAVGTVSAENLTAIREYIMEHEFHLMVINWIVLAGVVLLMQYIFPMFKRKTIGMKILGLYLKDENAQEITKTQYIKREFYKLILFPTMFLMRGKEKRALYDRKAKVYLLN